MGLHAAPSSVFAAHFWPKAPRGLIWHAARTGAAPAALAEY